MDAMTLAPIPADWAWLVDCAACDLTVPAASKKNAIELLEKHVKEVHSTVGLPVPEVICSGHFAPHVDYPDWPNSDCKVLYDHHNAFGWVMCHPGKSSLKKP